MGLSKNVRSPHKDYFYHRKFLSFLCFSFKDELVFIVFIVFEGGGSLGTPQVINVLCNCDFLIEDGSFLLLCLSFIILSCLLTFLYKPKLFSVDSLAEEYAFFCFSSDKINRFLYN